jgi:hypothetical protein
MDVLRMREMNSCFYNSKLKEKFDD